MGAPLCFFDPLKNIVASVFDLRVIFQIGSHPSGIDTDDILVVDTPFLIDKVDAGMVKRNKQLRLPYDLNGKFLWTVYISAGKHQVINFFPWNITHCTHPRSFVLSQKYYVNYNNQKGTLSTAAAKNKPESKPL